MKRELLNALAAMADNVRSQGTLSPDIASTTAVPQSDGATKYVTLRLTITDAPADTITIAREKARALDEELRELRHMQEKMLAILIGHFGVGADVSTTHADVLRNAAEGGHGCAIMTYADGDRIGFRVRPMNEAPRDVRDRAREEYKRQTGVDIEEPDDAGELN